MSPFCLVRYYNGNPSFCTLGSVSIFGRKAHALIDPGATISVLSGDFPTDSDPQPVVLRKELRVMTPFAEAYPIQAYYRKCGVVIRGSLRI